MSDGYSPTEPESSVFLRVQFEPVSSDGTDALYHVVPLSAGGGELTGPLQRCENAADRSSLRIETYNLVENSILFKLV